MTNRTQTDYIGYLGLETTGDQFYQWPVDRLVDEAVRRNEGVIADNGALAIYTGKYTGRSPNDRFIVDTPSVHDQIGWGETNRPISPEAFDRVFEKFKAYLKDKDVFVFDGLSGADPKYALPVRHIDEMAAQNLFAHQMFIRPSDGQLENFQPGFTVISAPGLKLDPATDGVNSEVGVLINFDRRMVLIAATSYSGEIKKSMFSVMNYLMPERDVFPMHCSCNVSDEGRSALFFGLSGTGKTTLSADPARTLIGDDEHGWSTDGVFNFEGGCYAKAIRLSKEDEPEIWAAIRHGALAENIPMAPGTDTFDYNDESLTENTRVAYPVDFIPNVDARGRAGHPGTVIFLTADAFGVLPPISRLTKEQAQYHFISGYTSKLAGTERGITEPKAAFSTCFGAPFMPRPPAVYARMLHDRIEAHDANVFLVNTGWQGGAYGVGKRIRIPYTRAMVNAALDGKLNDVETVQHPVFKVMVPRSCPGVPAEILDPRAQWEDKAAYDQQAEKLARMFVENFRQFDGVDHLVSAGPVDSR